MDQDEGWKKRSFLEIVLGIGATVLEDGTKMSLNVLNLLKKNEFTVIFSDLGPDSQRSCGCSTLGNVQG